MAEELCNSCKYLLNVSCRRHKSFVPFCHHYLIIAWYHHYLIIAWYHHYLIIAWYHRYFAQVIAHLKLRVKGCDNRSVIYHFWRTRSPTKFSQIKLYYLEQQLYRYRSSTDTGQLRRIGFFSRHLFHLHLNLI